MKAARTVMVALAVVSVCHSMVLSLAASTQSKEHAETIVVPVGTEIRVQFTQPSGLTNMIEGKVAVPVRVGWATAIPADSKVKMNASADFVELASITVREVEYKVKTNAMPLFTTAPGSGCELGFVLRERLEVAR